MAIHGTLFEPRYSVRLRPPGATLDGLTERIYAADHGGLRSEEVDAIQHALDRGHVVLLGSDDADLLVRVQHDFAAAMAETETEAREAPEAAAAVKTEEALPAN